MKTDINYITETHLGNKVLNSQPSHLFEGGSPDEFRDWEDSFRSLFQRQLGIMPQRGDLSLQELDREDCGSYFRQRLIYQSEEGVFIPAFLLVPKDASAENPVPGMLCIHGHGDFGKDSVVGLDDSQERRDEIARFHYDYGRKFVEEGYVVLAPDLRGFGQRRDGYPALETGGCCTTCNRNYLRATLLGSSLVGLNIFDLQVGLDVLESLDCVQPGSLACAGLSLGGKMAMMISAYNHRIGIVASGGVLNCFQERYQHPLRTSCGSQIVPGLQRFGDTPEIFSLIAPCRLIIEVGDHDPCVDKE